MASWNVTRPCPRCGVLFTLKHKAQLFCSHPCASRKMAARSCAHCDLMFKPRASDQRCCSPRCGNLARRPITPADRFWSKVNKNGPIHPTLGTPCWIWTASLNNGYGIFSVQRSRGWAPMRAHRWAYEAMVGPIPEGLTLDHLCRNHPCVNPQHLEPVTRGENVLRGEGIAAINAKRTHCKRGHPFNAANTYLVKFGRCCRVCQKEYQQRLRDQRKAERHSTIPISI